MANLILNPTNTPAGAEAISLHYKIENALSTAANAMVEMSRCLKTMRDRKLYTELGFDNFESYVEQAHGLKQRQAYTYIQVYEKLSPKLMAENSELGITKLSLLCQVSAIDREDFAKQNDLAGMTVEQVKALIEEKNGLHQQISLLQTEVADKDIVQKAQSKEIDRLKNEVTEKNKAVAELSTTQQPIDVIAVETEKIEAAVEQERIRAEKEKEAAVKEAVKLEKKKAKSKLDKQREDFEKNQKAAAESLVAGAVAKAKEEWQAQSAAQQSQLEQAVTSAQAKVDALEKQLKIKGSANTVKFSILFASVQQDIETLEQLVEDIRNEDAATAEKLGRALAALFESRCEIK